MMKDMRNDPWFHKDNINSEAGGSSLFQSSPYSPLNVGIYLSLTYTHLERSLIKCRSFLSSLGYRYCKLYIKDMYGV